MEICDFDVRLSDYGNDVLILLLAQTKQWKIVGIDVRKLKIRKRAPLATKTQLHKLTISRKPLVSTRRIFL